MSLILPDELKIYPTRPLAGYVTDISMVCRLPRFVSSTIDLNRRMPDRVGKPKTVLSIALSLWNKFRRERGQNGILWQLFDETCAVDDALF